MRNKLVPGIWLLENTIQEYHWGSRTEIADLLGNASPTDQPQAELWMGAHPKAPSIVNLPDEKVTLEELLLRYPSDLLGDEVERLFTGRLPFLYKILAADSPLSIQAHPTLEQAREGYNREETQKVPMDAPHRNYKDPNHKPEIFCALSPSWVMKGFRSFRDISESFAEKPCPSISNEIGSFLASPSRRSLKLLYGELLSLSDERKMQLASELADAVEKKTFPPDESRWIRDLSDAYPGDPGVLSPLLLNLVHLKPGDALATQAGELHAYLGGYGVELMANSDNVLRGGLTTKHKDRNELLRVVDFTETKVDVLSPQPNNYGERIYPTETDEFQLTGLDLLINRNYISKRNHGLEIWIIINGQIKIQTGKIERTFMKGQSFLIPASLDKYLFEGNGLLYRASIPLTTN